MKQDVIAVPRSMKPLKPFLPLLASLFVLATVAAIALAVTRGGGQDSAVVNPAEDVTPNALVGEASPTPDCSLVEDNCRGLQVATDHYDVAVRFDEAVTPDEIDATDRILRAYAWDGNLSYIMQETFPLVGHAKLWTNVLGFCDEVRAKLEAIHGVGSATCQLATTPGAITPDVPVSSTP